MVIDQLLDEFDSKLRTGLSKVLNVDLSDDIGTKLHCQSVIIVK